MKRFVHGPILAYSPYLALALFLMLLLTSLNYFYLSTQNYQLLSSNTNQQKDIDNLQVLNSIQTTGFLSFSPSIYNSVTLLTHNLYRQNELREITLDRGELKKSSDARKTVLQNTEEELSRCVDDKTNLIDEAKNISGTNIDELVDKERLNNQ